jgi:hypothetical protein
MSKTPTSAPMPAAKPMANGSGAAAVLSAGVGSFSLAVLAIAADQSQAVKSLMNFYHPTGPLSGVTTTSVLIWLVLWIVLEWRWRDRNLAMGRIGGIALVLLVLSLLLTFPPIADLF